MLIPDVLALPLAEAIARLEAAEIGYTVADTQPPRRQNEVVAEKIAVEYGSNNVGLLDVSSTSTIGYGVLTSICSTNFAYNSSPDRNPPLPPSNVLSQIKQLPALSNRFLVLNSASNEASI